MMMIIVSIVSKGILFFTVCQYFFRFSFSLEKSNRHYSCPNEVISPIYEYEIPENFPTTRNPLLWGKEDLQYFKNSPHLSDFIKRYYPSVWSRPVLFSVIADEKYINAVEIFLESLLSFRLTQNDVLIVSTSSATTEKLMKRGIRAFSYGSLPQCSVKDVRCIVSLSKFNTIIDVLNASYSIFFFDLDVFFKRFPLPTLLNASVDLYSQRESNGKYPFNFGCFLVKPTPDTINTFVKMREEYLLTRKWDQVIYNLVTLNSSLTTETFPVRQYPALHIYAFTNPRPLTNDEIHSTVIGHATCIEGAQNKLLLGREIFRAFSTPLYYHPCHSTITIAVRPEYEEKQLLYLMKVAIQASQLLRRDRIRVIGWDYIRGLSPLQQRINWKALYDPDLLYVRWNITIVESDYWKHFKHFHPTTSIRSLPLPLSLNYSTELRDHALTEASSHRQERVDDLFLSLDAKVLLSIISAEEGRRGGGSDGIEGYSNVLCKHYNVTKFTCLRTCSGNHFR